jgi:hypothetical protein
MIYGAIGYGLAACARDEAEGRPPPKPVWKPPARPS